MFVVVIVFLFKAWGFALVMTELLGWCGWFGVVDHGDCNFGWVERVTKRHIGWLVGPNKCLKHRFCLLCYEARPSLALLRSPLSPAFWSEKERKRLLIQTRSKMIPQQWASPCGNQCTSKYPMLMQIPCNTFSVLSPYFFQHSSLFLRILLVNVSYIWFKLASLFLV
jgi:hypothetical protein